MARRRPGFSAWVGLALAVLMIDQLSKIAADALLTPYSSTAVMPFFNLTLVYNEGAAFSFLSDAGGWQRWLFVVLAAGVSVVIVVWLVRLPRAARWPAIGLALVLGGALGNLWDRLVRGAVVDFVDLYYGSWHWPAFNVADVAICIGAGMLVLDAFRTPAGRAPDR